MIVARTIKGYGASETADVEGKHGQPLKDPDKAIEELGNVPRSMSRWPSPRAPASPTVRRRSVAPAAPLRARRTTRLPTRKAFGEGLAAVMARAAT